MPCPRRTCTSPGWVPAGISTSISPSGPGTDERRAERRLRHRQLDGGVEVVAVALDARLRPDADLDEEVAGRAAERARVPFAAHADPLAVVDAGGNVDVERALVQRSPDAVAGRARRLDDAAEALAAGQVPVRTNWPKTLWETCCTRPAPPHMSQVTGTVPGAAPLPPHVSHVCATRVGDADGDPGERLGERDLGARRHVAAAARPARAGRLAEERLAEEGAEDVGEVAEVEIGRREAPARGALRARSGRRSHAARGRRAPRRPLPPPGSAPPRRAPPRRRGEARARACGRRA